MRRITVLLASGSREELKERKSMKLIALMSAAAIAAAALAPTAALADHHHGGWKWKTSCKTVWHHGHKSKECHKVRYR